MRYGGFQMSVMGSIFSRVFDDDNICASASSAAFGEPGRSGGQGPLTFPQPLDVEGILTRIAARRRESLNWRRSIVDLLKLLNLDSSFAARAQLAQELGYGGRSEDSAAMNVWLHREVMRKLGESHPKVLNSFLQ
jgi:hypothetical protein